MLVTHFAPFLIFLKKSDLVHAIISPTMITPSLRAFPPLSPHPHTASLFRFYFISTIGQSDSKERIIKRSMLSHRLNKCLTLIFGLSMKASLLFPRAIRVHRVCGLLVAPSSCPVLGCFRWPLDLPLLALSFVYTNG